MRSQTLSRYSFSLVSVSTLCALSACSSIKLPEGKIDYKAGTDVVASLEVPPDLSSPEYDQTYAVPANGKVSATRLALQRTSATTVSGNHVRVLPKADEIQLMREGNARWLEIKKPADALWPKLREFWRSVGVSLKRDEPTVGIMETEWAENRAEIPKGFIHKTLSKITPGAYDAGSRDRFRLRVERASDSATRVFVTHNRAEEVVLESTVKWEHRPADPELEAEMMNRLVAYLSGHDKPSAETMVEASNKQLRTELGTQEGRAVLFVHDVFARIWLRTGVMLERSGMAIDDQNRSQGIYYVTYRGYDKGDKKGWLSNFFNSGKNELKIDLPYQVHLADSADKTVITFTDEDGDPLPNNAAKLALERLEREFLR